MMNTTTLTGQVIGGKYRIDERIGRGGFATVYKAYQLSLGRPVAIKVLENPEYIKRFEMEAAIVLSLRHPNIVHVLDIRRYEDRYFIVMDYVDGPSLKQVLDERAGGQDVAAAEGEDSEDATRLKEDVTRLRNSDDDGDRTILKGAGDGPPHVPEATIPGQPPLSPGEVAKIALDISSALGYAHRKGVVHRDVKPANILISPEDKAMLTDFGIARVMMSPGMTQTGMMIGSIPYMSPEQLRGEKVDGRSDIYSLGIVMYELLTGVPPFTGTSTEIMQKHLTEVPLPPGEVADGVPDALDRIVLKCLEKDREKRYESVDALAEDIRSAVQPASLLGLIGRAPAAEKKGEKEEHREEHTYFMCPDCWYVFPVPVGAQSAPCPACGTIVQAKQSESLRSDEIRAAKKFVSQFDLGMDFEADVRKHEYSKRVVPVLKETYKKQTAAWEKAIGKGSVVSPLQKDRVKRKASAVLETVKSLFSAAKLWNYSVVSAFVVSGSPEEALNHTFEGDGLELPDDMVITIPLDEERQRKKHVNGLLGRAYQLLGLYHTIKGARGKQHGKMKDEYETAEKWFRQAAHAFGGDQPDHSMSAELSRSLAGLLGHYFKDGKEYEAEIEKLKPNVSELSPSMPWIENDLEVAETYEGAHERFRRSISGLQERIDHLLDEAQGILDSRDKRISQLEDDEKVVRSRLDREQKKIQENYEHRVSSVKTLHTWIIVAIALAPLLIAMSAAEALPLLFKSLFTGMTTEEIFGEVLLSISAGYLLGKLTKGVPEWIDPALVGYIAVVCGFRLVPWQVAVWLILWAIALYVAHLSAKGHGTFWKGSLLASIVFAGALAASMPLRIIDMAVMLVGALAGFYVQKEVVQVEYEALKHRGERLREVYDKAKSDVIAVRQKKVAMVEEMDGQVDDLVIKRITPTLEKLRNEAGKYSLLLLRHKSPEELAGLRAIQSRIDGVKKRLTSESDLEAMRRAPEFPAPKEVPKKAMDYTPPRPTLEGVKLPALLGQLVLAFIVVQVALGNGGPPSWPPMPVSTPTVTAISGAKATKASTPTPERATATYTPRPTWTPRPPTNTPRPYIARPSIHTGAERKHVVAHHLNVRRGPGADYDVITQLSDGQKVTVEGMNSDRKWSYITSPVEGWVSSEYIASNTAPSRGYCIEGRLVKFEDQPNPLNEIWGRVLNVSGHGIRGLKMKAYVPCCEEKFHVFAVTQKDGSFYWAGLNPRNKYAVKILNPPYRLVAPVEFKYARECQKAVIEFRITACP